MQFIEILLKLYILDLAAYLWSHSCDMSASSLKTKMASAQHFLECLSNRRLIVPQSTHLMPKYGVPSKP